MKKILMAAVALICMAMTSAVFTSCTEEKTTVVMENVYYKYDASKLYVADGQEATFTAFAAEMGEILTGNSYTDISESELIQLIQAVVDSYNNQSLSGTIDLLKSIDGSTFKVVKTFTLKCDPKYIK